MAGFSSRFMTISTSPRSPYRIQHYLNLLSQFEGKPWSREIQTNYYHSMVKNQEGDFAIGASKTPDFSARDKINRAPKAFGFVQLNPTIKLTDAGKAFLNPHLETETLIRQILKFQLPSPYLPEQEENRGYFNIKPFLELLRLIRTMGELSTNEFRAFGITMTDHRTFDNVLSQIKTYRINESKSGIPKKKFYSEYIENFIKELYADKISVGDVKIRETQSKSSHKFIQTKVSNIKDYADAYLRFLIGTGLVLVNKNRKIVISKDKVADVDFILATISKDAQNYSIEEYEKIMFNPFLPELLTDNLSFLQQRINQTNDDLIKRTENLIGEENIPFIEETGTSILDLKIELQQKEELLKNYAVEEYSVRLKSLDKNEVQDIIDTFKGIENKEFFDNPLFLEWNCWRAITMINHGKIIGSFKTNTLGEPIGTAGGNTADIIGNYGHFNMICEVTMSGGKRQYEMENESVMRHLGELRQRTGRETFGLFIAPSINDSLIAEFYYKHKIPTRIYGGTVEFIPFTIKEFTLFFQKAVSRQHKFTEQDIENIHIKSKEFAINAIDEIDWHNKITKYLLSI